MKPLASPREEFRLEGAIGLGLSVLLGVIVTATAAHPLRVLASFVIAGALFGAVMYVVLLRRYLGAALKQAREISNPQLEPLSDTRRRVATRSGVISAVASAFALVLLTRGRAGGVLLGILAGNGVTFLVLARHIRRWETTHTVEILREPRWRGRWEQGRFGRGVIDPQDFYSLRADVGSLRGGAGESVSQPTEAR
jgi:positive regulator of sigma E activity